MPNLNYGTYAEETAEEEHAESESSGGADFMKLKVGRNIVRILPPAKGQRSPFYVVFQHFIEMPGGSKSVICARLMKKQPCAVCEHVNNLRKSKLKVDQDAANDLYARRRVFANVIDRQDEAKGPKVLGFGKSIHEQLTALRTDPEAGGDYCDPIKGIDIIITRTGTGKNDTKYSVALSRKTGVKLAKDGNVAVMQEWIDSQKKLEAFAKLPSIDEVRQLLSGEAATEETPVDEEDEDEDEDEEEEAPRPKKTSGAVARAKAQNTSAKAASGRPTLKKKRTLDEEVIDVEPEDEEDVDEEDDEE